MNEYLKPLIYNGIHVHNTEDLVKIVESEFNVDKLLTKDTYKSKV